MKVKFKVYHTYGLVHEEEFELADLGVEFTTEEQLEKDLWVHLVEWTNKHYSYGDAASTIEILE